MTDLRPRPGRDLTSRPLEWNPPRQAISRVPYLPGLDGLRALAVVAVMLYHTNQGWLKGGYLGVEVFFVISGYLITLLIIAEHEKTGQLDLVQFWQRRARRLLPALFVMMALLIVYVALFEQRELGKLRGDVFAGLGYVSNWYQVAVGQGYTAAGDFAPLRHLWSLAVEEQFYLLWPLAMLGLMRLGRRRLPEISLWLVGVALAIAVVVAVLFHPGVVDPVPANSPDAYWNFGGRAISKNDTLYLSTVSRATGLLIGSAFAMLWRPVAILRGPMRTKGRQLDVLALVGLGVLGALAYVMWVSDESFHFNPWLFRGGFVLVAAATVAVIPAVTHRDSLVARGLANPVFNWVGTRSYGLYLYHWPIYQIIRERAGAVLTSGEFVAAMAATVVITELSYRLVEMPVRKRRVRRAWEQLADRGDPKPRQLVVIGAVVAATLLAFSSLSMVRADLRQNELAETLAENEGAVTGLDEIVDATTVAAPATIAPTAAPDGAPVTVPATEPPVETTEPPPTLPESIPRLAIGDSVMLGAASSLDQRTWLVDAAESRQFSAYVPILRDAVESGKLGETQEVVVHLGTNGTITQEQADEFFALLEDVPRVMVLTVAGNQSWIAPNNAILQGIDARYDNVHLGYFAELEGLCGEGCFYDENLHMNAKGADYYADAIDYWFSTLF